MRNAFYFFIFVFALQFSLYAQNQTEYTYIFEKEKNIVITNNATKKNNTNDSIPTDILEMTILRRDIPLVNRLVRFVSATPDIFIFENDETSFMEATDKNGTITAPIEIKNAGRGIAIVHLLYVGANVSITNITHEEYITLNVDTKGDKGFANIDDMNFTTGDAFSIYHLFPPYLFLNVISLFIIGYFKRLKEGSEYPPIAKFMIATLFGFSSIKKNCLLMIPFFVVEIILFYLIVFTTNPLIPTFFLLFAMASYFVPKDRAYSVSFMLFAIISIVHYISLLQVPYMSLLSTSGKMFFVSEWYFLIPFFILMTAFLSNVYIPLVLLSFMQILFSLSVSSVSFAIIGITIGFILFILKRIFNIKMPIFYKLNILKVDM